MTDEVIRSDTEAVEARPQKPRYGTLVVRSLSNVGPGDFVFNCDVEARYITIKADKNYYAQLGAALDLANSVYTDAAESVTLPSQGYRAVTVRTASTNTNIWVIWHDDPTPLWQR